MQPESAAAEPLQRPWCLSQQCMCDRDSLPAQSLPRSGKSGRPAPFQGCKHFGRPEPDCPAEFEGWDHAGNAPLVELAAADFEKGGERGLGEEF
jgi:hypothetical protein